MKKFSVLKKEDSDYLKDLGKLCLWSFLIFTVSLVFGFLFIKSDESQSQNFLEVFRELSKIADDPNNYRLMVLIFLNNSIKITIATLLGVFGGFVPALFLIINGFLVGVVTFLASNTTGWGSLVLGILPHGIFEVPALIIGGAIGLRLGNYFFQKLKNKKLSLKLETKKAIRFIMGVIIPVLFFASFVEVFMTKTLLN